jgi:hypothetical protein
MFRIAAIVILSAATTITAVGWVWSYAGQYEVRSSFESATIDGWTYTNSGSSGNATLFLAGGHEGSLSSVFYFDPSWDGWLPGGFRVRPYRELDFLLVTGPGQCRLLSIICPFWLPFLLLAGYPAFAITKHWITPNLRRRAGKCVACGYSLVGNESGTCPECGESA